MITVLNLLAIPVGLAVGTYFGLRYWHWAQKDYEGFSKMRPVSKREPF